MFLVWSGWGVLVLPIVFATSVAVGGLLQWLLIAASRPELAFLAFSGGLFAAAAVNWLVGRGLNNRPGRELLDPKTQQRVILRRVHRLFWIRMEYWSVPVALAALIPLLAIRHMSGG